MKLFMLVGLLFVLVLCLSVSSTEGRNPQKYCCESHKQISDGPNGRNPQKHCCKSHKQILDGPNGMPNQPGKFLCKSCKSCKRCRRCKPCKPPKPKIIGPLSLN